MSMDVQFPKNKWRFKNADDSRVRDTELIVSYINDCYDDLESFDGWKNCGFEPVWQGHEYFSFCYTYGVSIETIYKLLNMDYRSKELFIEKMIRNDRGKKMATMYSRYYGLGKLIDIPNARKNTLFLLKRASRNSYVEDQLSKPLHFDIMYQFMDDPKSLDPNLLAEVESQTTSFFPYIYTAILKRHSTLFNAKLKHEIDSMYNTEERRLKKRKAFPSDLVSLPFLCDISLALDYGLQLKVLDSIIPIWDFPIAKRPEIQKLLPGEAVERIPKA